ncbi:MAG TPA: deaminase [Candidatus Saccharimonadales bacterium]|jgi:deoxycytidylate deaminase|nr:deaminase [Candidatus Saccharimonadales bacterium]
MSDMQYNFEWSELAFASKKPIHELNAIFIAAPRDISHKRFIQIVKQYLPKGNLVLGLAKEAYIDGFEGQPQFKTLETDRFTEVIGKINANPQDNKIFTLSYNQRDLKHVLSELDFTRVLLINGSWQFSFHTTEPFYALAKKRTPYKLTPAFLDETEAQAYEKRIMPEIKELFEVKAGKYSEAEMLDVAAKTAKLSFDYSFQTGVALGKKAGGKKDVYELRAATYNKVVPYQTYAMLHGASREKYFSPPHDLNHYDTVHAEAELIIKAGREHIPLKGTTMFINLMPCPSCARMLSETDIDEFVYSIDHSDGYAVQILEAAGKKVRRVVA